MKILGKDFYNRPTLLVAEELLGKYLVIKKDEVETAFLIHEVEAYDGFEDKASHAHKGKTARTTVMFGPAGFWYVYLVYGMYWMLNIVTGAENYPAAILIRGVGDWNGPGKLTRNLGIDKSFNEKPATRKTGLWIEDRDLHPDIKILTTPRIGVDYAGEDWANKPYRFLMDRP